MTQVQFPANLCEYLRFGSGERSYGALSCVSGTDTPKSAQASAHTGAPRGSRGRNSV